MAYLIKTNPIGERNVSDLIVLSERAVLGGNEARAGASAFLWESETAGGAGLSWRAIVVEVAPGGDGFVSIKVLLTAPPPSKTFGNTELESFKAFGEHSGEFELYRKLRSYSHNGIRRLSGDASSILLQDFEIGPVEIDAMGEMERHRLSSVSSRPGQREFSVLIRHLYSGTCAVTGCRTGAALEAAHVKVEPGRDQNDPRNGILLRCDIHALFDVGLIALSEDGIGIEVSEALKDGSYEFLRTTRVTRPRVGAPSTENIRQHRKRFGFSVAI